MADTKVSAFTNGSGWAGTDILGAARAGANVRGTVTEMVTFVENNISIGTALGGSPSSDESILIDPTGGSGATYQRGGTAIGFDAVAGDAVDVDADFTTAIGWGTLCAGKKGTAIGHNSQVTNDGTNGVAIGDGCYVAGVKATGIGNNCNIADTGGDCFSVGIGSTVDIDNDNCIVIGQNATAAFDECILFGFGTIAADFAAQFKFDEKYLRFGRFTTAGLLDTSTQEGHAVYDTDKNAFMYHDGTEWVELTKKYQDIAETTGTTYTYVLGDAGKHREFANASATTVTVPPNSSVAFPVGTQIDGHQGGAGQVTIAQGAGVTIRTSETLKIRQQYCGFSLKKIATDEWVLFGDLEEA